MEGALAGIPSIALSQSYAREGMGDTVPFAAAEAWAEQVLRPLVETPMEPRTLVNVNFPALPPEDVKGIRVTQQGLRDYGRLRIVQRTDPRGYDYFWFGLGPMIETPSHSTDLEAIADGYVAVTPLHLDLTHGPSLGRLAGLYPWLRHKRPSLPRSGTLRRKSPLPDLGADRLACRPRDRPSCLRDRHSLAGARGAEGRAGRPCQLHRRRLFHDDQHHHDRAMAISSRSPTGRGCSTHWW
jgi:hypothetical protein